VSVSGNGDAIVVGAPETNPNGANARGAAYIYYGTVSNTATPSGNTISF
jgi:hypothetical protein